MNAVAEGAVDVLVEPRAALHEIIIGKTWKMALVFTAVYMVTTTVSTILILENDTLVSDYIDRLMIERPANVSIERLESVRQRTTEALTTPGIAALLGVRGGISRILRLSVFWAVLGLGGALGRGRWKVFPDMVLVAAASTPILTLGIVINLLLRMIFRDLNAVAGPLPLVGHCGSASAGCFLLATMDLFVLWYLAAVSTGCAVALEWSNRKASAIVIPVWILYVVCSFLMGIGACWTM